MTSLVLLTLLTVFAPFAARYARQVECDLAEQSLADSRRAEVESEAAR